MKLLVILLIIIPIWYIVSMNNRKKKKMQQIGIRTTAKLIGYERIRDNEGDALWHPILEYKNENGKIVKKTINAGASWKMYSTDAELEILYDPENPDDLIVCTADLGRDIFLALIALFILYILSSVLGAK